MRFGLGDHAGLVVAEGVAPQLEHLSGADQAGLDPALTASRSRLLRRSPAPRREPASPDPMERGDRGGWRPTVRSRRCGGSRDSGTDAAISEGTGFGLAAGEGDALDRVSSRGDGPPGIAGCVRSTSAERGVGLDADGGELAGGPRAPARTPDQKPRAGPRGLPGPSRLDAPRLPARGGMQWGSRRTSISTASPAVWRPWAKLWKRAASSASAAS